MRFHDADGLVQDCSNSITNTLELPQFIALPELSDKPGHVAIQCDAVMSLLTNVITLYYEGYVTTCQKAYHASDIVISYKYKKSLAYNLWTDS